MSVPLLGQGNTEPAVRKAQFALLLTRDVEGTVTLSTDIVTPVEAERSPTPGEVMDALHNAYENLHAQQIAAVVMSALQGMGQMAMRVQQDQAMMGKLKDLRV
jgi:hypothetical protein